MGSAVLVCISDGRANVPLSKSMDVMPIGDPLESLEEGKEKKKDKEAEKKAREEIKEEVRTCFGLCLAGGKRKDERNPPIYPFTYLPNQTQKNRC